MNKKPVVEFDGKNLQINSKVKSNFVNVRENVLHGYEEKGKLYFEKDWALFYF